MSSPRDTPTPEHKWIAGLASAVVALSLGLIVLVMRGPGGLGPGTQRLLDDPEIRSRVIQDLVGRVGGTYDTHNDPEVGRVLLPGLRSREHGTTDIDTNSLGLREEEFELPKPSDLVRVVILGDSFVFGSNEEAENRMGVFLERFLQEEAQDRSLSVEVLHLGIMSWDIVAESEYVRRQISLLQPDLVIQITVPNDLDDPYGVRGFGTLARFSPRLRDRANGVVLARHPTVGMEELGHGYNLLAAGHDALSRGRFAHAARRIGRLARTVERLGGDYLIFLRWLDANGIVRDLLCGELEEDQVVYASSSFSLNLRYNVSETDPHWNRRGMKRVAQTFFGAILSRDLLPMLDLRKPKGALSAYQTVHGHAPKEWKPHAFLASLDHGFDFSALDQDDSFHFYGGIDRRGLVAPYAAFSFRSLDGGRLHLRGRALDRPEIDGATVSVRCDEEDLGLFTVQAGEEIDLTWPLPASLAGREFVSVELFADDYAFVGDDLQQCAVMWLESLGVEP